MIDEPKGQLSPELHAELAAFMPPGWKYEGEPSDAESAAYLRYDERQLLHAKRQRLHVEIEDNINRAEGLAWSASANRLEVDSAMPKHERGEALRWLSTLDPAQLQPLARSQVERALARGMRALARGEVDLSLVEQVRKRGAPIKHAERDLKIGREIDRLWRGWHGDLTIEEARAEAALSFELSEDRVKDIYKEYRKDLGNRLI